MGITRNKVRNKTQSPVFSVFGSFIHPALVFSFNPLVSGLKDEVSGTTASLTRSGSLTGLRPNGLSYYTVGADKPLYSPWGLMSDGAGTNLIPYSEDFSQWWGLLQATLDYTTLSTPLGSASKVVEDTSDDRHAIGRGYGNGVSITADTTLTYSIFAKKGERQWIQIDVRGSRSNNAFNANFDLENGVVGTAGSSLDGVFENAHIEYIADGLYRCSITGNLASGDDAARFKNFIAIEDGVISYQGDGSSGLYVIGTQLEEKPYASSYIPTNGSTASRATQAADSSGNGVAWDLSKLHPDVVKALDGTTGEGTILLRWRTDVDYGDIPSGNYGLLTFNDNETSGIYIDGSGNIAISDGTNTVSNAVQPSKGDTVDIAMTYSGSTLTLKTRKNGGSWTTSTGSFDGAVPHDTHGRLAHGLEIPNHFGKIKQYKAELTNESEIEQEFAA